MASSTHMVALPTPKLYSYRGSDAPFDLLGYHIHVVHIDGANIHNTHTYTHKISTNIHLPLLILTADAT